MVNIFSHLQKFETHTSKLLQSTIGELEQLAQYKEYLQTVFNQVTAGPEQTFEYDTYPDEFENLPKMVKGLPPSQVLQPMKLGKITERLSEYLYSEIQFNQRHTALKDSNQDPLQAFFSDWIHAPEYVIKHWQEDTELCRQLIQGVNPMVISQCQDASTLPAGFHHLTAQGKSVDELAKENRLFVLDYDKLSQLPLYKNMIFYAPIMVVYNEVFDDGNLRLNILGIQLTRDESDNIVYTPQSSQPNRYALAKLHVACADNQYHQFIYHLGFTHLAMEPFAIAHHNTLSNEHPIGALLAPHFHDTIGINFLARQTLISPVEPMTDDTFATGTQGALKLFQCAWKDWNFMEMSFPNQLKKRGFDQAGSDGVRDYFFREDGFKIWRALETYVNDVVDAVYASDNKVKEDTQIQAWSAECQDPNRANIPGFPGAIDTREQLREVLTNIIFTCSAQHSAVNFSQYEYLSFIPNRPDALFKTMPEGSDDISPDTVQSALPDTKNSNFQIMLAHLLTTPSLFPLSSLPRINETLSPIHDKFLAHLHHISLEITHRNESLKAAGKNPYTYLMPENIASSIAI